MNTKSRRYRVNERFYWIVTILTLALTMAWLIADYNNYQADHQAVYAEESVMTVEEFEQQIKDPEPVNLGLFKITHYTNSIECCGKTDGITASGAMAKTEHTIAADPKVLPFGTKVMIDGITYTVEDTGGAIKGNKIDIFVGSMDEAITRGVIEREVYLIK